MFYYCTIIVDNCKMFFFLHISVIYFAYIYKVHFLNVTCTDLPFYQVYNGAKVYFVF